MSGTPGKAVDNTAGLFFRFAQDKPMKKSNEKESMIKGIFLAYAILVLHVVLLMGLGFLVFFFRGIIVYMGWILAGGFIGIAGSAYYFYRKMKREAKTLKEMIRTPLLNGRSVEVSIFGGLASLKIGKPGLPSLPGDDADSIRLLEDPSGGSLRDLQEMVRLFEKGLISLDEYNQAKKRLLK
jgi:hypothetical protein